MNTLKRSALTGLVALSLAGSAEAQNPKTTVVGYWQQSFPKQTVTNQQIEDINAAFGANFPTWKDKVNGNIGVILLRDVTRNFRAGAQFDYSRGSISGEEIVETPAGPAIATFKQSYDRYFDLLGMGRWHFKPDTRFDPFLYGAAGMAYEKDDFSLRIANDNLNEDLFAKTSGTMPIASIGAGLEFTGGYTWAHKSKSIPAQGSLSPGNVIADTNLTGPNYTIGIGKRW
jgi:hypothetical protein